MLGFSSWVDQRTASARVAKKSHLPASDKLFRVHCSNRRRPWTWKLRNRAKPNSGKLKVVLNFKTGTLCDSRENFSFVENRKKFQKRKTVETLKTAKNRTQLLMILFSSKITRTDVTFARSHTLSLFLPLSPSLSLSLSLSLSFFLSLQGLLLPIFFSSKRAWVALYLSATVATHRHLRTTCQRGFSSFEAAATAFEKLLSLSRSPARLRRLQRNLQWNSWNKTIISDFFVKRRK